MPKHSSRFCLIGTKLSETPFIVGVLLTAYVPKAQFSGCSAMNIEKIEEVNPRILLHVDLDRFGRAKILKGGNRGVWTHRTPDGR